MVDLCHGPHLPNTGYLKSAAVGAVNRAFWRADVKREPLQVSFLQASFRKAKLYLRDSYLALIRFLPFGRVNVAIHLQTVCDSSCRPNQVSLLETASTPTLCTSVTSKVVAPPRGDLLTVQSICMGSKLHHL